MPPSSPSPLSVPRYEQAIATPLFLAGLIAGVPTALLAVLALSRHGVTPFPAYSLWYFLSASIIVLALLSSRWLYLETRKNNHPGIQSLAIGFGCLAIWRAISLGFFAAEDTFWSQIATELWVAAFASFTILTIGWQGLRRAVRSWMTAHPGAFWVAGGVVFVVCAVAALLGLRPAVDTARLSSMLVLGTVTFLALSSIFVLRLYLLKRTTVVLCFGLALYLHGLQVISVALGQAFSLSWWLGLCFDFASLFLVAYGILEANRLQERLKLLGTLAERTQELERSNAELRNSEDQLRQALKMEAIGRLAGGVAHDFNNLLTIIHGFSDLLLQDLEPSDPRRAHAEKISNAARNASSLTYQLLAFSRKQRLAPVVLSLNMVVRDFAKMLPRLLGEDIELSVHLCSQDALVRADRSQLEQVIMNLAVNARDAMPKGGRLTIETAAVELDDSYSDHHFNVVPGRYVMLAITDTGLGIDATTQQKIFDPFFTTKEMGKGTGLGLSTVYGIVKQSDGHVWVYSEVGKGTTFKVYLPRAREQAESVTAQTKPAAYQGSETVLVVEDADDVRNFARLCLAHEGYTVLEARNATEATRLTEEHGTRISLLVTDVVMPGFSGLELAEELLSLHPNLRVLMMSGYADVAFGKEADLPKGSGFLAKPFTREMLLTKVRQTLDQSTAASSASA